MIPVEFVGGPLDGEGEVHPLHNVMCLNIEGHPGGYYTINPYQLGDGKLYWIQRVEAAQ